MRTYIRSKPARYLFVVTVLAAWIVVPIPAAALSPAQKKLFDAGVHYYDLVEDALPTSCPGGGNATSLTGSTQEEKIFNFFISKGLTAPAAAGIMGNLSVESGYDPFNQQNGLTWPTGGWGIAQWTAGRRDTIRNAVTTNPEFGNNFYTDTERLETAWPDPTERAAAIDKLLLFQLNYLYNESVGRDVRNPVMPVPFATTPFEGIPKEWDALKKAPDVQTAVIFWEWNYERAGIPALGDRLTAGNTVNTTYGSNAGGAGAPITATGGCGSGRELTDGFAMPVDRQFYLAHNSDTIPENQRWFTKTHHDYPAADIPVPSLTEVYSMTAGTLHISRGDCGTGVKVDAGNGIVISYCHGTDGGSIEGAKEGDTVTAGQLIMHSDNTGNSDGPHLHVHIGGPGEVDYCPQNLFKGIMEGRPPAITSLPTSGCTH
ncbi:MAG TPA: phage tail tip lysozyme [Verrucomicrobiae bacterium]|nr:phage tail tip lysozyme [Verrucomicrobiae bacterium]